MMVSTPQPLAPGLLSGAEEDIYLDFLHQWVADRIGLQFSSPERRESLRQRLLALCDRQQLGGLEELYRRLREGNSTALLEELTHTVCTSHTYFNREEEVLRFLQEKIVPGLAREEMLRLWCAAVSSGEEAYTVALLLAEVLGPAAGGRVAVLGTDINHRAIDQAERGIYDARRLADCPPEWRRRYFHPAGLEQWRVGAALKQMCTFRRLNLMSEPWPFQHPFHVILCRNVLYYFDRARQVELVERMYAAARPGGWLLTSVTESLHGMPTRWQRVTGGVYRKEE